MDDLGWRPPASILEWMVVLLGLIGLGTFFGGLALAALDALTDKAAAGSLKVAAVGAFLAIPAAVYGVRRLIRR